MVKQKKKMTARERMRYMRGKARKMRERYKLMRRNPEDILEEERKATEALIEESWLSCQTDVNKLVKRNSENEPVFGSDEDWPEDEDVFADKNVDQQVTTDEKQDDSTEEPMLQEAEDSEPEEASDDIPKTTQTPDSDDLNTPANANVINEEFPLDEKYEDAVAENKDVQPTDWVIEKRLCRCCHAEGDFASLLSDASDDASYLSMLRTCFNLEVLDVSGAGAVALRALCGLCAARLRDAHEFCSQVRAAEARFQQLYADNCIQVAGAIKDEVNEEIPKGDDNKCEDEFGVSSDESTTDGLILDVHDGMLRVRMKRTKKQKAILERKKQKMMSTQHKIDKLNERCMRVGDSFKCRRCDKTFPNRRAANSHFDRVHMKTKMAVQFQCKICQNTFISAAERTKHMLEEHGVDDVAEQLKYFQGLKETYTQVGDLFKCTGCDKKFKKLNYCHRHFDKVHLNLRKHRPFQCNICQNRFVTRARRTTHKLEEHNIDERQKCNACDRSFNTVRQFDLHVRAYHMMGEKINCAMCDYVCYDKISLKRHMFKHSTSKDFICRYCSKAFLRRVTLNFHERIHTGDKRKTCAECGQTFVQKASLNYHMAKYHPEVRF